MQHKKKKKKTRKTQANPPPAKQHLKKSQVREREQQGIWSMDKAFRSDL